MCVMCAGGVCVCVCILKVYIGGVRMCVCVCWTCVCVGGAWPEHNRGRAMETPVSMTPGLIVGKEVQRKEQYLSAPRPLHSALS